MWFDCSTDFIKKYVFGYSKKIAFCIRQKLYASEMSSLTLEKLVNVFVISIILKDRRKKTQYFFMKVFL